jgi:hypothetical protein
MVCSPFAIANWYGAARHQPISKLSGKDIMRKATLIFGCVLILISALSEAQSQEDRTSLRTQSQITNHGGKIETKYDGFKYETVMSLRKMKVTCDGMKDNFKDECTSMIVSLHCPGVQLSYVRYVTLQLIFESKDWDARHPLDQRELSAVTDSETLKFGRMQLVSQNVDTLTAEILEAKLSYADFKKITMSNVVELQVGKSRFQLREKNIAALRDLNNRVNP